MLNRRTGLLRSLFLTIFLVLSLVACGSESESDSDDEASHASTPSAECVSVARTGLTKLGYYWDKSVLNNGRNLLFSPAVTEWKTRYLDLVGDLHESGCSSDLLDATMKFDEYLDQDEAKANIDNSYLEDDALEAGWKAIETDQLKLGLIEKTSHGQGPPKLTDIDAIDDPYILAIAKAAPSLRLLPESFLQGAESLCGGVAAPGMTSDEVAESRLNIFEAAAQSELSASKRMEVLKIMYNEFCPEDLSELE